MQNSPFDTQIHLSGKICDFKLRFIRRSERKIDSGDGAMSDMIKKATRELSQEAELELNKENPFKKLHYSTDHLPYFHEFSSLTGLYGRHYIPILKARWYQ